MSQKTQVTANGIPKGDFPTLKQAKRYGKHLIREFKRDSKGLGGINIQYVKL